MIFRYWLEEYANRMRVSVCLQALGKFRQHGSPLYVHNIIKTGQCSIGASPAQRKAVEKFTIRKDPHSIAFGLEKHQGYIRLRLYLGPNQKQ